VSEPLRVFIGMDPRQPVAFNVAAHSVMRHSSKPVAITALNLKQLPITRRGLTGFTYSRFLVPYLCGFKGKAVFMDADMVVTGDIAELFEMGGMNAVSVVQDQERFEWPSMMLFSCGACIRLTPEFVQDPANKLFDFEWAPSVGSLPKEWNQVLGYGPAKPGAKLWHWTRGLPVWQETQGLPEDEIWFDELEEANKTCDYADLMGQSIHAQRPKC
jgi:hypothetical protein